MRCERLRPTHGAGRTGWVALTALAVLIGAVFSASALASRPYVAIDPGHGDKDTGAVGVLPSGYDTGLTPRTDDRGRTVIYEKDVNLDIAERLDAALKAWGARTLMTRTRDLAGGDRPYTTTTADLKARTDQANEARVDLFVSIHNNAIASPAISGTETFHFTYSSAASKRLASEIQAAMVRELGLPDRGVKEANFYVLRHTVMPAVLIEGAFLSNPSDARLLADPSVRQKIADAVLVGIRRYNNSDVPTTDVALAPTIGPWKTRPGRVPTGYQLVKTGRSNPVGRGGWLAVRSDLINVAAASASRAAANRPATIGPWTTRPRAVPEGYRLVKTGRSNATGRGGWLAVRQ